MYSILKVCSIVVILAALLVQLHIFGQSEEQEKAKQMGNSCSRNEQAVSLAGGQSSTASYGAPALDLCLSGKLDEKDVSYGNLMKLKQSAWLDEPIPFSEVVQLTKSRALQEFRELPDRILKPVQMDFTRHDIYSDIHPYIETQILVGPPEYAPEKRYINANRIRSVYGETNDDNLIVAAQGPITASSGNFWKMVHQERVSMIVTLVHKIPGDCDVYFPMEVGKKATYEEMELTCTHSSKDGYIHHRVIQVKDNTLGTTSQVDHYHFQGWEDWQLPEGDSRAGLADLVEKAADFVSNNARKQGDQRHRLLVHCRAGIGRTGTTISLINSVIAIKEQMVQGVADPQLSVFSIVRKLREQRLWMVQTDDQYAYIYEFLRTSKWANNN